LFCQDSGLRGGHVHAEEKDAVPKAGGTRGRKGDGPRDKTFFKARDWGKPNGAEVSPKCEKGGDSGHAKGTRNGGNARRKKRVESQKVRDQGEGADARGTVEAFRQKKEPLSFGRKKKSRRLQNNCWYDGTTKGSRKNQIQREMVKNTPTITTLSSKDDADAMGAQHTRNKAHQERGQGNGKKPKKLRSRRGIKRGPTYSRHRRLKI